VHRIPRDVLWKRKPSLHLHKILTQSNEVSPRTFQTAPVLYIACLFNLCIELVITAVLLQLLCLDAYALFPMLHPAVKCLLKHFTWYVPKCIIGSWVQHPKRSGFLCILRNEWKLYVARSGENGVWYNIPTVYRSGMWHRCSYWKDAVNSSCSCNLHPEGAGGMVLWTLVTT